MNQAAQKLGELLVEQGDLCPKARDKALDYQTGGKLGQILYKNGDCNSLTLYQSLARQRGLPFANLLEDPPQQHLLQAAHLPDYLRLQILPWQHDPLDDTVQLAAVEITQNHKDWAAEHYPNHRFVQTAPMDIQRALTATFPKELSHQSIHHLALRSPIQSARILIDRSKHVPLLILFALLCAGLFVAPAPVIIGFLLLMNLSHLLTLSFKSLLFTLGARKRESLWNRHHHQPRCHDKDLPSYTILVPLYKEAASLPHLVSALRALDYPKHLLDIKLIIEEDDIETCEVAKALRPEGMFEILRVPYSEPRTKPKACNYALRFARGDIITIYDAEDRPHPQQLREVVHRFQHGPENLVCVQCRLNYYNRPQNWLTRLFSIEYAAWFDFMIPGLDYLNLPIPLGGTSNHLYRQKLLELGEWDPFNVTEDADLGIRLASLRYRTEVIRSQTMEEAPARLWPWLKQRSRWIKGYMQTWLVHMRRPIWLWQKMGWRGFMAFQFFIGGPCLVFLSTPALLTFSVLWALYPPDWSGPLTTLIWPLSLSMLFYGVALHLLFAVATVRSRAWPKMGWAIASFPFYWLLHSAASFRALSQLITRPHYWEKTEHGLWKAPQPPTRSKNTSPPPKDQI